MTPLQNNGNLPEMEFVTLSPLLSACQVHFFGTYSMFPFSFIKYLRITTSVGVGVVERNALNGPPASLSRSLSLSTCKNNGDTMMQLDGKKKRAPAE